HPATGHRTRRPEHPRQRDRAGAHRHRGEPDHHTAGDGRRHREEHPAVADGPTGGPRRHVSVPAVGSGQVEHRPDLQRRRRTDHPLMSTDGDIALGYIGLGKMGAPMAKKLVDWPGGLIVFDVRPEAMTRLAEKGATLADSVADVATADVISVTVLDDEQVRDVVGELATNAKPGTVIAIHSTISPDTAVELAERWEPQGVHIVDAPVTGGGGAAKRGELAVMVGATDEAYAL